MIQAHAVHGSWVIIVPVIKSTQPFLNLLRPDKTLVNVGVPFLMEDVFGLMSGIGRRSFGGWKTAGIAECRCLFHHS